VVSYPTQKCEFQKKEVAKKRVVIIIVLLIKTLAPTGSYSKVMPDLSGPALCVVLERKNDARIVHD
jgi:hypothetical protein